MRRAHLLLSCLLLAACLPLPAQRFPKPEPERAFAEQKLFDASGSALRIPREDWEAARDLVQADDGWKAWLAERRADLEIWMAEERDKPEYVAGWWHDFVNPTDGGFLQWTPDPPANAPPKVFGGWVYGLRSRNGMNMVEAARMWRLTGDTRYFDWASGQLDFYAEHLAGWPIQTSKIKAQLMHQSLDDANMLVRFVETARLLEADVPPRSRTGWEARRRIWIDKLFRPMTLLLDETMQRIHNIACWQRSAMAMAAIYTRDEELWKKAVDGEFGIRRQVREGITSDYFWLEQSLGYNSYVVSAFLPLFTMAGLEGRLPELRQEALAVENLMLAPATIAFDDGLLPTPADTTGALRRWPDLALLASARRVFPTVAGLARAKGARDWQNLLDPADTPRTSGNAQQAAHSRNLESTRFAMLRKDGWQVFFHYGQLDRSHSQAEALHYEAHFGAVDVTHDAGTVGYGSPLHRGYYTTAAAHNVPVIDGEGQEGWDEGELLRFSAAEGLVSARQKKYRPDVSVTRTLSIEDGALVERTKIEPIDGEPHRLGILLHVQGEMSVPAAATAMETPLFAYWSNGREWRSDGPVEVVAQIGGREFLLRVEGPAGLRVVHASVPDAPPRKRQALYVEASGPTGTFIAKWIPR